MTDPSSRAGRDEEVLRTGEGESAGESLYRGVIGMGMPMGFGMGRRGWSWSRGGRW